MSTPRRHRTKVMKRDHVDVVASDSVPSPHEDQGRSSSQAGCNETPVPGSVIAESSSPFPRATARRILPTIQAYPPQDAGHGSGADLRLPALSPEEAVARGPQTTCIYAPQDAGPVSEVELGVPIAQLLALYELLRRYAGESEPVPSGSPPRRTRGAAGGGGDR